MNLYGLYIYIHIHIRLAQSPSFLHVLVGQRSLYLVKCWSPVIDVSKNRPQIMAMFFSEKDMFSTTNVVFFLKSSKKTLRNQISGISWELVECHLNIYGNVMVFLALKNPWHSTHSHRKSRNFAGKTPPKIMGLWDPSQACATKAQRRVNTAEAARLEPSETFLAATTLW
jgi:hypothetical protein